jgi:hypothetical protein
MTEREAFKFGFLLRCAEEGLDGPAAEGRAKAAAAKRADGPIDYAKMLGGWLSGLGQSAVNVGTHAYPLVGIASLMGGAGLGYAAGRATDPGYDADDVRRQELIAAYGQAADDMDEDLSARKELGR